VILSALQPDTIKRRAQSAGGDRQDAETEAIEDEETELEGDAE
jgi:hypothetical protein